MQEFTEEDYLYEYGLKKDEYFRMDELLRKTNKTETEKEELKKYRRAVFFKQEKRRLQREEMNNDAFLLLVVDTWKRIENDEMTREIARRTRGFIDGEIN